MTRQAPLNWHRRPPQDDTTLDEIGRYWGTDKASTYPPLIAAELEPVLTDGIGHNYCVVYDAIFTPLRHEPITMLELGWGGYLDPMCGGRSAAMWREYFTKATIVVVDCVAKVCTVDGVDLYCGLQQDKAMLDELGGIYGGFDIVIDDASHDAALTQASFEILWPHVRPDGYYCVEDTPAHNPVDSLHISHKARNGEFAERMAAVKPLGISPR